MICFLVIHLLIAPLTYWPFGPGVRAQTKPAASSGTMIFGILAFIACIVGASIGTHYFLELNGKSRFYDFQVEQPRNAADADANAVGKYVIDAMGPINATLSMFNTFMKNNFNVVETDSRNITPALLAVDAVYNSTLSSVFLRFNESMPSLNFVSTGSKWIPEKLFSLFRSSLNGNSPATTPSQTSSVYLLITEVASIAMVAVLTSWIIITLHNITSDKGRLNQVRRAADNFMSVTTAALSLTGTVLLAAIYTFDAVFIFSAGYYAFSYPLIFRIFGLVLVAVSLFYFAWLVDFFKALSEMHTLSLTFACTMALNVLVFHFFDINAVSVEALSWSDNFNPFKWEPSFVLFLFFMRYFVHATSALGSSLCDRIDGGPDSYFNRGVADIHQVQTAMYDSFDVIFRMLPVIIIWRARQPNSGAMRDIVETIDKYYGSYGNIEKVGSYVFTFVKNVWDFLGATVVLARDLLLNNPTRSLTILFLWATTQIAFGSDGEDRYNPIGDIKKYLSNAVTTVQENIPVLSAKKEKPAASPKAAPRAGSAKRK